MDYSTDQVIEIVQISRRTLQYWLTSGKIKKPKDQGRGRRWTAEDIKTLIKIKHGDTDGQNVKGGKS